MAYIQERKTDDGKIHCNGMPFGLVSEFCLKIENDNHIKIINDGYL